MSLGSEAKARSNRDLAGKAFLVLWIGTVSVLLSLLAATHLAAFTAPATANVARSFVHGLNRRSQGWQLLHVLADGCACSGDVIHHLLARGPDRRTTGEGVVLVGHRPDLEAQFVAAGFSYTEMTPVMVAGATGIEAAPTLVVLDDEGVVRYAGGYYAQRARTSALDQDVLSRLMAGQDVASLPLFGCAFSRRLQAAVDPLGLSYRPTNSLPAKETHR